MASEARRKTVRKLWLLWLAGFTLKLIGASWDVSWHFKNPFDVWPPSPPHVINTLGFLCISLAFLLAWRDRTPERQPALNTLLVGFATFLVAIPADQAWHVVFGLDITTWSPSHLLLFSGTAITCAGALLHFLADVGWRPREKLTGLGLGVPEWLVLGALLLFLLEAVSFPLGYNEYTVVGAYNLLHGFPLYHIAPALQAHGFAMRDPTYGDLPHWLYPMYGIGVALLFCVLARRVTGVRGAALAVASAYALERLAGDRILASYGFATSALPWHLIGIGLAVEIAFLLPERWQLRPLAGITIAVAASYAWWAWRVFGYATMPLDWMTLPWAVAAAFAGWILAELTWDRLIPWLDDAGRADPTRYAGATVAGYLTKGAFLFRR